MTYLTASTSHSGHWRLGEQELAPGDVIEVLLLDTWYRAHYQYDGGLGEYQFLIAGHPFGTPLLEGQPVRWPETVSNTEGQII